MNAPPAVLTAIAEAIADGRDPGWESLDLSALDDQDRREIAELHAVFHLARCLGTVVIDDALSSRTLSDTLSTPASDDADDVPAAWGSLEIRERVGRGRFGNVYRAWDPAIGRDVALKILRPSRRASAATETGVIREAQLMARVRHPNVLTIYGAARLNGRTALWMEFIEGRTLETELRERGRFDAAEITQIGMELCRALSAVHGAGLVHRDVKAQNVLRDKTGRVVLGDFGTGLDLDDDASGITLAGTPLYFAPELLTPSPATVRSDVYGLGVLLYHLATDAYPVTGRNISELRRAHDSGSRRRLADVRSDLQPAVIDAIERALQPDPALRFESAEEMERALGDSLVAQVVVDAPITVDTGRGPTVSTSIVVAGVVAATAVVVSIGAFAGRWLSVPGGALSYVPAAAVQTQRTRRVPEPDKYMFMGRPSPDGRTFTYTDISGDLAVFDTGSGATRKITQKGQSTESAYLNSATSFDGTHVAYTWEAADGAKELRIIPVEGGSPRIILRVTDGYPHPLQWSVDGTRMLTMLERDDGPRTLAMLSVSDGRLTPIAEIDARHSSASLSPDGRYVVYDKGQEPNAFARDVYLAALDPPGATTALVTGPGDEFGPLWAPQGDRLLFVSDRSGEPSLWTVLVSDGVISGEPVMAHRNIGGVTPLGISTDGTLFYNLRIGLIDVYVASIDFDAGQVVDEPRSVAPARIGSNITSSWSPDGRRLAYVTLPPGGSSGGPRRLTVVDVDTGDTRVLSPSLGYYQGVRWSPDGRAILVKGWDLESRRGLFLVDPETGAPQQVAAVDKRTPKEIGSFHWHPLDPYQILFTRWDIGLRALDLRTGAERSVFTFAEEGITSIQAGIGFRPAPDGRAIAYVAFRHLGPGGRGETVLRVKEIGGGSRDVALGGWLQDWTRDGQHLLYWASSNDPDAPKVLSMIPAAGGTPRETGLKIRNLSDLSVHPDGRRVTFTAGLPASELWALENFLTARF